MRGIDVDKAIIFAPRSKDHFGRRYEGVGGNQGVGSFGKAIIVDVPSSLLKKSTRVAFGLRKSFRKKISNIYA